MRKILISLIVIVVAVPLAAVFAQHNSPVSKTFKVSADSKIVLAEGATGVLTDLTVGNRVRIAYHTDGANSVADQISLIVKAKGAGIARHAHCGGKRAAKATHVHGIITAVDATTGTVTMNVWQHRRHRANQGMSTGAA